MKVPTVGATVPPRDQRDWLTTQELVIETGITYRQADYWIRTGLLTTLDDATPGTGYVRRIDTDQLQRARGIQALLSCGFSLQVVRDLIDDLITNGTTTHGRITLTLNQPGDTAA